MSVFCFVHRYFLAILDATQWHYLLLYMLLLCTQTRLILMLWLLTLLFSILLLDESSLLERYQQEGIRSIEKVFDKTLGSDEYWNKKLQDKDKIIITICGGYEMMFEKILDPFCVESSHKEVRGIGRFKGEVTFQKEKIVQKLSTDL